MLDVSALIFVEKTNARKTNRTLGLHSTLFAVPKQEGVVYCFYPRHFSLARRLDREPTPQKRCI